MILVQIALILFYILIFLISFILFVFIIPFSYSASLKICNTDFRGNIYVKWLMGAIGARIILEENCFQIIFLGKSLPKINIENKIKSKKPKKSKQKKKKKYKRKIHIKDIELKELFNIFKDFIFIFFDKFSPKYFKIKGKYGFQDPSITGMTYGVISILNNFKFFNVDFYPIFTQKVIDVEVETYGKFRLINLIIILISTIIKKPVRKLIFRKKKKSNLNLS